MSDPMENPQSAEEAVPSGEAPETETPSAPEEAVDNPVSPAEEEGPADDEAEKLRSDMAAEKERYLRLAAEYDNYRKRSARERDNIYADVKADTIGKLLPVFDNLQRALQNPTSDEAYRKGVEMTVNQFLEVLKAMGVTPIDAVGQTFDPALHHAVMHTEDPELGEQEIVQEFQKGFKMGERVIRFSMVQVAN